MSERGARRVYILIWYVTNKHRICLTAGRHCAQSSVTTSAVPLVVRLAASWRPLPL